MPELPEVQTIASDLNDAVRGLTIAEAAIGCEKIIVGGVEEFCRRLAGAEIEEVRRLGKWLHFRLTGRLLTGRPTKRPVEKAPAHLLVHLKMTGQFQMGPWPAKGLWPKHIHAALRLSGRSNEALLYRDIRKFGRLRAFDQTGFEVFLKELNLGPDPLLVTAGEFHGRLTARRGRLKAVLLDQTVMSGFGNIYADESLFAARLSPLASAAGLSRAETGRLLKAARRIFTAAIAARGSTTSNYQGLRGGGTFQARHQVYGRAGLPCPACGTAILRLLVGGRSTHVCPACQGARVL